jgi:hypothetical protein
MVLRGSAAASIVVPLLDLAPALADDDDDDGAIQIPRITHRAYLDVVFGDNRGIGLGSIRDGVPAAVKNGWLGDQGLHSAAVVFTATGPRIVVVLTHGLNRDSADRVAGDLFARALAWAPEEGP